MGTNELTKAEALNLITPVIDGEASAEEYKAFMEYIAHHEDVRKEFETMKQVKLLCRRCPCAKAPDSLRDYVRTVGKKKDNTEKAEVPIYDVPGGGPSRQGNIFRTPREESSSWNRKWIYSAAASLLIMISLWSFFDFSGQQVEAEPVYNVEEYAYEYYMRYEGKFVAPTISTASLGSAEVRLASDYDISMRIPSIENAEFQGVVYNEFVPDFNAPMLEYYLPADEQYIYIFAFKLEQMREFGKLERYQKAVKKCNKPTDFYVRNINGMHVVSWKWDNVWYAAISNHEGDTLASRVKSLQINNEE